VWSSGTLGSSARRRRAARPRRSIGWKESIVPWACRVVALRDAGAPERLAGLVFDALGE